MKPQSSVPMVPRHVSSDASEQSRQAALGRLAIDGSGSSFASESFESFESFESLHALQDLVSALDPQSAPIPPAETSKPAEVDPFTKLIAVCASGTRTEAVKSLVQQIAKQFPGAVIQAGIGSKTLRRFVDSTLGWLGPESEMFRDLAQTWRILHGVAPPSIRDVKKTEGDEDSLTDGVDLPGESIPFSMPRDSSAFALPTGELGVVLWRPDDLNNRGDNCILITIASLGSNAGLVSQFDQWCSTLATVIWNRPSWIVPQWAYLNGNRRVIALAIAASLMVAMLFPTPYRVKADVRIEPQSPRIVSAPFEATIHDVMVHPGDIVKAGQTLLTLDGRPLRLERQSLEAEIYQSAKQKDIALAAGRVAEAQQAQLKYQQLLRRRDLIDRRLEQLTVSSPIDGVVVSGDLRRSVGASLELGRVLLEIAPLDRVLVEIAIPEYEISMVETDAKARIRVDASGVPTIDQSITEIYPAGELREDEVVFISLIELDNNDGAFRPGMTGKATVYGDYRPFVWPYMRRAIDQVTWLIGL